MRGLRFQQLFSILLIFLFLLVACDVDRGVNGLPVIEDENEENEENEEYNNPPPTYNRPSTLSIIQDFFLWGRGITSSQNVGSTIDAIIDTEGTGYAWRFFHSGTGYLSTDGRIDLRSTPDEGSYAYTLFDTNGGNTPTDSIDLTGLYATAQLSRYRVWDADLSFRLLIYDGYSWFLSESAFDMESDDGGDRNFLDISSTSWSYIYKSEDLNNFLITDDNLPALTLVSGGEPELANIKGMGWYLEGNPNNINRFTLNGLSLHEEFLPAMVDLSITEVPQVSRYLWGICMTGYQGESVDPQILNHLSEWCEVIRWAGGSAIENYNLKYHFNKSPSSNSGTPTGEWIDIVRSYIPNVDFNIGVPSSLGMTDPLVANTDLASWLLHPEYESAGLPGLADYAEELVTYLNLDYTNSWGVNPVRSKSAEVRFIEVGNEPNWMFNNHSAISGDTDRYELINMAYRTAAERLHQVDPDVLVIGPSCMKGSIDSHTRVFMEENGDVVDVLSTHRYNGIFDYEHEIRLLQDHIKRYGVDNNRRTAEEIKTAFTEYNEHTFSEYSWKKAMWFAEVFSIFLNNGLDFATTWHTRMGSSHAMFAKDANGDWQMLPAQYILKFYHDYIDLDDNPRIVHSSLHSKVLRMVGVEMDNQLVIFVINPSEEVKETTINLYGRGVGSSVKIDTMREGSNGEWAIGQIDSTNLTVIDNKVTNEFAAQSISAVIF